MTTLTIYRGASGCGKSTTASLVMPKPVIVSRDAIRITMFGAEYGPQVDESVVTTVEDASILAALRAGHDVICDDTNVRTKYAQRIANLGFRAGATVVVQVFDVALSDCLVRNSLRAKAGGRSVPDDVIRRQHDQLKKSINWTPVQNKVTPYKGTELAPKSFMFDVDGTLAHMNGKRGPFEWHNVGLDDADRAVSSVADALSMSKAGHEYRVVVLSGRDGAARAATTKWLQDNDIWFDALFMRAEGDMRPDEIVKAELFDTHVRDHYDVVGVFDDRPKVCRMWREMGIPTFQVGDPENEF